MGLILDGSELIADERGKFDKAGFLRQFSPLQPLITGITASELLHGVERAQEPVFKARRQRDIEQILSALVIQPFGLAQGRVHARIWAELGTRGQMIGPHDLQNPAAGLALGHEVATLSAQEFQRVNGIKVAGAMPFRRR